MKKAALALFVVSFINLLFTLPLICQDEYPDFSKRKSLTIVITDSGLGGLDVLEDISKKIEHSRMYKNVTLIFVNALFEAGGGYNTLQSRDDKIEVFNNVLLGIEENFKPDIILIACNTLSVIYKETKFVKQSSTPVKGIVESGVGLILDQLSENKTASVIITGTETTISENNHKILLQEAGINDKQICTQACPQLQSYIEHSPHGDDTGMLISVYVDEALAKLSKDVKEVYLSLNCSHFGYSKDLWREAFSYTDIELLGILNPNEIMGDFLFPDKQNKKYRRTNVNYRVYSKVEILNMLSIKKLFEENSPELANALNNYDIVDDLF